MAGQVRSRMLRGMYETEERARQQRTDNQARVERARAVLRASANELGVPYGEVTFVDSDEEVRPVPAKVVEHQPFPALAGFEELEHSQLVELIKQMVQDWKKLNEIHNNTAVSRGWCSDYEERQSNYNMQFKVLRLYGRDRRFYGAYTNGL